MGCAPYSYNRLMTIWCSYPGGLRGRTAQKSSMNGSRSSSPSCIRNSRRWKYDEQIDLFRRRDDPEIGYAHGNMDGYWYLNDEFHLESLQFVLVDPAVDLKIPRLSGPKGVRPLIDSARSEPSTSSRVKVGTSDSPLIDQVSW